MIEHPPLEEQESQLTRYFVNHPVVRAKRQGDGEAEPGDIFLAGPVLSVLAARDERERELEAEVARLKAEMNDWLSTAAAKESYQELEARLSVVEKERDEAERRADGNWKGIGEERDRAAAVVDGEWRERIEGLVRQYNSQPETQILWLDAITDLRFLLSDAPSLSGGEQQKFMRQGEDGKVGFVSTAGEDEDGATAPGVADADLEWLREEAKQLDDEAVLISGEAQKHQRRTAQFQSKAKRLSPPRIEGGNP